jgi:diguanylate cyclase (GGDEF)-like protein
LRTSTIWSRCSTTTAHDCKVALDDLGAGYSSLNLLVRLRPDIVKLDKDGTTWWNELHLSPVRSESGKLTHYLGYQHDVTDRVEAEEALARQAMQDSLTGLANRSHLLQQLHAALDSAAAAGHAVAVLFIDLDGFKVVNDTHGHAAGDSVLIQVADRLRAVLRASDLICRNGGDEFVAVLHDLDLLDAARIAERAAHDVTVSLQRPFVAGPGLVTLGGSVGVALYPQNGATPDRLLAVADSDMYQAKKTRAGSAQGATTS